MEPVLVLAIAIAIGVAVVGSRRILASKGTIGAPVPPGSPGIVQAPLEPMGTVLLAGETWSAHTADDRHLERGIRVRLVAFDGLIAIVEPADPGATPPTPVQPAQPADRS